MDADLAHLLLTHGDEILLRREAMALGVTDKELLAARRREEIFWLTRGAYCRQRPESVDEHRRLLSLAALRLYPDAQLTGLPAVAAWDVPITGPVPRRLDITRPLSREVLTPELRIRPHRTEAVRAPLGPADPLPAALVQMTLDHGVLTAVPSIDAALHTRKVTVAELEQAAAAVAGWPRSGNVRCALAWMDGRAESLGESLTRVHLTAGGIVTTPQVKIRDRNRRIVARVDLEVDGHRVLIEFDGKVKYRGDEGSDVVFEEKKREDSIRRLHYIVVRVVWADLYRPLELLARVRQAIRDAATLPASP